MLPASLIIDNKQRSKGLWLGFIILDRSADFLVCESWGRSRAPEMDWGAELTTAFVRVVCHISLSQCRAAGHPPASREKVHGSQVCPILTASSPLQAAPCLSLHHCLVPCSSSWGSRESCTGIPGCGARKGGKRRKITPVQEDCPAKSIPKEKS